MTEETRFAPHLARLRTRWPQAWISEECDGGGMHLVALPGFLLPPGWNATICTVLWLARLDYRHDRVGSPFEGFYADLPNLRLADESHPQWSRGGRTHLGDEDVHLYAPFEHWRDLTRFWWKAQVWDPNRDNIFTHAMLIRQRLRPAR